VRRFFHVLFASCDGISALSSESLDRDLTRVERLAVRFHALYCVACRRYRAHIRALRAMLRSTDEAWNDTSDWKLSPQARARIVESLNR